MRISRPPHHNLCGRRKVHGGSVLTEEVHPEIDVLSLKALIEDTSGIAMSEQRILYKGRALRDEVTLEEAGVIEDSQLYVAMDSGVNAASANVDASAFVPQPGQQPANNDPMAAMLNNPLVSSMLDNPEVLRTMIQANPQMRQMMEDNPELAQIMNDPAVLRQSLQAARNPQLMREQMRNTDRAMSNIEAHPGGHNMLRRMYQTVQAPLYDMALDPAGQQQQQGGQQGNQQGNQQQQGQQGQQGQQQQQPPAGPNTSALPNPWARPAGGGGAPPWGGGMGGGMGGGFPGGGFGGFGR